MLPPKVVPGGQHPLSLSSFAAAAAAAAAVKGVRRESVKVKLQTLVVWFSKRVGHSL